MSKKNARTELEFTTGITHKPTLLFIILAGFFVVNALVAEFVGVKIMALEDTFGWESFNFNLFGQKGALQFSAGVLLWPVVFIMTDVINEYYGKRGVRLLTLMTAGLIAYAFMMIFAAIWLAPAGWWQVQYAENGVPDMQAAFKAVFGQSLLIIIGSLVAFLSAQMIDVISFHRLKKMTGGSKIWLRATGSTLISQLVDTFVILIIAFKWGPELTGSTKPWTWGQLLAVATVQYAYKFVVAVVLTPTLYWAHAVIDRFLGKELAEKMKIRAGE